VRANSQIDLGGVQEEDPPGVLWRPCAAKVVRQISNGYVANVATTPAVAPDTNATAFDDIVVYEESI
jgi:hypothetical protein